MNPATGGGWYASGDEALFAAYTDVMLCGAEVAPRGARTRELLDYSFVLENPHLAYPGGIGRPKLNVAMAVLEFLQNVAGESRADLFAAIAPLSSKSTRLVYGERLRDELPRVVKKLQQDPSSRQAVSIIWKSNDIITGGEDVCTVGLQFLLRDGKLNCITTMRSNDVHWGLCYDLPQFAWLQCTIANVLNVLPGWYSHRVGSIHLYERHWPIADQLTAPTTGNEFPFHGISARCWEEARSVARRILDGDTTGFLTREEERLWAELEPYQVRNAASVA